MAAPQVRRGRQAKAATPQQSGERPASTPLPVRVWGAVPPGPLSQPPAPPRPPRRELAPGKQARHSMQSPPCGAREGGEGVACVQAPLESMPSRPQRCHPGRRPSYQRQMAVSPPPGRRATLTSAEAHLLLPSRRRPPPDPRRAHALPRNCLGRPGPRSPAPGHCSWVGKSPVKWFSLYLFF